MLAASVRTYMCHDVAAADNRKKETRLKTCLVVVGRGAASGSLGPLLAVVLVAPAPVHGVLHNVPVVARHGPDEEDLDVVLHRHQFRVVDSRLPRELFALFCHLDLDWGEAELWLSLQKPCLVAALVNDAVLCWFDASLLTALAAVRKYGHASAVAEIVGNHDKAAKADKEFCPEPILNFLPAGNAGRMLVTGALRFRPMDLEDLSWLELC